VLGEETSHQDDSFADSGRLEHPQYTRPREFRGMAVPDVLLSGNHEEIARWRHDQSVQRTNERRPDLMSIGPAPAADSLSGHDRIQNTQTQMTGLN